MGSTYPPGEVSLLGINLLKKNIAPHITYVGPNGSKFYLAGPLAPTLGAQNGVAILSMTGLTPPYKHLDTQGARQDGTTWMDSVYDPAEIDFVCELSGMSPRETRQVIRAWLGAWSPKEQGRLHVFTPENGEWWARVRELKNFNDQITFSYNSPGRQKFTWSARNDDAFWESFDSTDSFKMDLSSVTDSFDSISSSNPTQNLGYYWDQKYWSNNRALGPLGGTNCGYGAGGVAHWTASGSLQQEVVNRRINSGATSSTDYQVISVRISAPPDLDFFGGIYTDIWGRMDSYGNGIRARFGGGLWPEVKLSSFTGGTASVKPTENILWAQPLLVTPLWNEKWTLICGTSSGLRNFKIQRGDGFTVVNCTEKGTSSYAGSAYRGWGFGMSAGAGVSGFVNQVVPPDVQEWTAGDNNEVTQDGFVSLVNRGDVEAWPRYLCYGPGTFSFNDGDSGNVVTFGPLLEDQLALVTSLPRLRSVVDLSQAAPQTTRTDFQNFVKALIDFATNNNVPPLLERFESELGILPPQGNLYSLLQNRFTTPIPAKSDDSPPEVTKVGVKIVGGNADSKIVAAITPRRRWPM